MEDSRNIIKAIDALTLKAGGEVVDSKNITEAIDHLKAVFNQEAIGIDNTLTQEGLAADAKAVGDLLREIKQIANVVRIDESTDLNSYTSGKTIRHYIGKKINTMLHKPAEETHQWPFALDAINVDGYDKQVLSVYTSDGTIKKYERIQFYVDGVISYGSWYKALYASAE